MEAEQYDQWLITAAMFYFDQRDAGLELHLDDVLELIPPELHDDLMHLVIVVNRSRASLLPDTEPSSKPIEVIQQALGELREHK